MTTTHDHPKHPVPTPPATTTQWVARDDESVGYPPRKPDIVARFTAPTGVEVALVNLSRSSENPDIAVIYESPRVSRGRSPAGTMLSPLELFLAFEPDERTPDVLVRHHRALARRGVFSPSPRALPLPLWAEPNLGLPTDYGDVDLCEGDFAANWNYFSLGPRRRQPVRVLRVMDRLECGHRRVACTLVCHLRTGTRRPKAGRAVRDL